MPASHGSAGADGLWTTRSYKARLDSHWRQSRLLRTEASSRASQDGQLTGPAPRELLLDPVISTRGWCPWGVGERPTRFPLGEISVMQDVVELRGAALQEPLTAAPLDTPAASGKHLVPLTHQTPHSASPAFNLLRRSRSLGCADTRRRPRLQACWTRCVHTDGRLSTQGTQKRSTRSKRHPQ